MKEKMVDAELVGNGHVFLIRSKPILPLLLFYNLRSEA